jgi:MraZ protein
MATPGPEENILLYKYDTWYERCQKVAARGTDESSLIWDRLFVAMAREIEIDKQQRFVIPDSLRQFTGLEKGAEIAVIGARDRVEIWRKDAWFSYLKSIPRQRVYEVMAAVELIVPGSSGNP